MRISTFFYTLKQGIINIFRNKWFSLASIATIGACLFLFGLFYSVLMNVQSIVKTAQEGISVTVLFDDGISQERIEEIGSLIRKRPEVSDVRFTSADEAWESFKEEYLGEYSDGFTENPLENSASYEIYLSDVSMQPALVTYLEGVEGIRDVNRSEIVAATMTGVNALIRLYFPWNHSHSLCRLRIPDQQYGNDWHRSEKRGNHHHEIYRGHGLFCPLSLCD